MTLAPDDFQRKVRQLDKDVQSIYELLVSIQAALSRHGNALDAIAGRLDDHAEHVASLDQRFAAIDDRLDAHDDRFDAIDDRLDKLEAGMTEVLTLLRAG